MSNSYGNNGGAVGTAVAYIVIGVLFCIFRSGLLDVLLTVVGALFVIAGIIELILNKNLSSGLLNIAIGAIIILGGWLFLEIVLIVFGVLLILKGVKDIFEADGKGALALVSALLTVVVGVLLITSKWLMLDWFFIILGAFFMIAGLFRLFGNR